MAHLPPGWHSTSTGFSCGSAGTGNGCQLPLSYAPTALASGTLALNYAYDDSAGAARSGVLNIPYVATTNDNVVGTPSPSGQVNAVVGLGTQPVTVTFTSDDGRPATALQITGGLAALPAGWDRRRRPLCLQRPRAAEPDASSPSLTHPPPPTAVRWH